MGYDPRQHRADVAHEREYRPLYGEKRCANCNQWRGQHIYTGSLDNNAAGLSNDALMCCPAGTSGQTCFRPYECDIDSHAVGCQCPGQIDLTAGRLRHIRDRDLCATAIEHDVGAPGHTTTGGLTDRQWLAQSVLNILDGNIDAQIRQEAQQ